MSAKSLRFEMRIEENLAQRVDNWAEDQLDGPSRAEAIRRLIEKGLAAGDDRSAFELMRVQILLAALNPATEGFVDDAYALAWMMRIYPIQHNERSLQLFEGSFEVDRQMMDELVNYLDEGWMAKKVPTFYDLETRYIRIGGYGNWDRMKLIYAIFYFRLKDLFGEDDFWKILMGGSRHPAEAKIIMRPFKREQEIYLS